MILNRRIRRIAKHNKKVKLAKAVDLIKDDCSTCKFSKKVDEYYGYSYVCKINYIRSDDEKCEFHILKRSCARKLRYLNTKKYKRIEGELKDVKTRLTR